MVIGRGWLVHEMTGSATAVGAVTFAAFFPFVVIGPLAGVVADRVDRRSLVLASGAVGIATAMVLAALTLADVVTVWHVVALAAISGSAQAATMPARQALLANLVAREHLLSGIALASIAQQGSRVFGPLVGGALLATLGAGYVFLAGAALLLLSQYPIWRIAYRMQPAAVDVTAQSAGGLQRFVDELREGVAYVGRDRRLTLVFVLVMLHCGLTMSFDSMMPTLATIVGGADRTYTALFVGMGVGAALSGLVLSMPRAPAITGRALAFTGFGSGVSMLLLGVAPTASLVVIAAGNHGRDADGVHGGHVDADSAGGAGPAARPSDGAVHDGGHQPHGVPQLRVRLGSRRRGGARAVDRARAVVAGHLRWRGPELVRAAPSAARGQLPPWARGRGRRGGRQRALADRRVQGA